MATKKKNGHGLEEMPEVPEEGKEYLVRLTDPSKTIRTRSERFAEIYCNRIELVLGANDFRMRLVHVLPTEPGADGKSVLQEQAGVTLTHKHLGRFLVALGNLAQSKMEMLGISGTIDLQIADEKEREVFQGKPPKKP